jgi:hypothetical protein
MAYTGNGGEKLLVSDPEVEERWKGFVGRTECRDDESFDVESLYADTADALDREMARTHRPTKLSRYRIRVRNNSYVKLEAIQRAMIFRITNRLKEQDLITPMQTSNAVRYCLRNWHEIEPTLSQQQQLRLFTNGNTLFSVLPDVRRKTAPVVDDHEYRGHYVQMCQCDYDEIKAIAQKYNFFRLGGVLLALINITYLRELQWLRQQRNGE